MKTTTRTRKLALTALLIALALFVSGCRLIVKDPEVDQKQVIVSVNGETMDKGRFTEVYNNALNREYEMQLMYQQYGLTQSINLDRDKILKDSLDSSALDMLLHQKGHELKLDELDETELAKLTADAQTQFEEVLPQVQEYYFKDTTLSGEELQAALIKKAAELNLTPETYLQNAKEQDLHEKLHAYTARDVSVSEEEIKADYDSKVEEAKKAAEANPSAYGQAKNGGQPTYYVPANYRFVKQILVKLNQDDQSAITALKGEVEPLKTALDQAQAAIARYEGLLAQAGISESDKAFVDEQAKALTAQEAERYASLVASAGQSPEDIQAIQELRAKMPLYLALVDAQAAYDQKNAELTSKQEAAYAAILPKANEIYEKATAEGADFDALAKEFNEDTGMPETGYAVTENFQGFDEAFVKPAMALTQVGEVAKPSRGIYGFYITQYASDIKEGPVALSEVEETIKSTLLSAKQDTAYNAQVEEWKQAADIQLFPERMAD